MRSLCLLIMALSTYTHACTPSEIEAATTLVLQSNQVIQAGRYELAEQSRQREWSSRVTIVHPVVSSDSVTATSPSIGLQVEIPFFDRSHELKLAQARFAYQERRDAVLSDFLGRIENLCSMHKQARELNIMLSFYRDLLEYRKEQVKDGLEEMDVIWKATEKAQKVEHDCQRVRGEIVAMQLAVARRFGGSEWKRLQVLLVGMNR